MRRRASQLRDWATLTLRRRGGILVFAAFCTLLALMVVRRDQGQSWWDQFDHMVGVGTLLLAIGVWIGETRQEWEAQLPRRLNAYFLFDKQPTMVCRQAYLSGEGDIRQWGQQIGAQMAGGRHLAIDPLGITQKRLGIQSAGDELSLVFQVVFYLNANPTQAAEVSGTGCLLWFNDENERTELRVPITDRRVRPE